MCVEREGTLSITVVGSIAFGCNDPVLEIKQKEAVKDHQATLPSALSVPQEKALFMVHNMGTCREFGESPKFTFK